MKPRGTDGRFVKAPTAITAAASVIPTRAIERMPRAPESWQIRAWRLWRLLGVVHFPTTFKAKQVGRLGWNVAINGELLDEEAAAAAMEAVTQPLGVREAATRIALNLEVAGQVFYARTSDAWNVYAATKMKLKELLAKADIVVEGIQPDPEEPEKPTSSIMAALSTAEAIRLMAQMSRAQDRNRLAQRGILLIPKEGVFPEGDDFAATLEEVGTAPIADEYAPSAVTPPIVYYPAEYIEKWRHLVLESPYDDKLMDRIDKGIVQFAREIDMPPEVLLGNMDSNHWNAWLSSEENYRGHIEPLGSLTGQVFAEAIKQAALEFAGADIKVTPDPAELLSRPPSFADALEALKFGAVSYEYVRRVLGADDEDAPTDNDIDRLVLILSKGATEEPEEAAPAAPQPSSNGNGQAPAIAAAADIPDDPELDSLGRALLHIDLQLLGTLRGQARMAISQARANIEGAEVGAQEKIATEMERLGKAWGTDIREAHEALRELGIDAQGPEWEEAADVSVAVLIDGMTAFITDTLGLTDSELPAIPTVLLREVMAAAGGSATATVAAVGGVTPTFKDPQGFAIGVLTLKDLKGREVELVQWRFRYGSLSRSHPFHPHKAVDGQYMTSNGHTKEGYSPNDHAGCLCFSDPVLRVVKVPQEV